MKKTSVLIIEDNDHIRESTAELLGLANYEVFKAKDGKQGVDFAVKLLPDIILCDITMPELDGYGVLHMLHKTPETSAIPFIFITAKSERLDYRKGMEMGADDYLAKPFNDMELMNAIETRLNKKNKEKDFYSHSLEQIDTLLHQKGFEELRDLIAERKIRRIHKKQTVYYEDDSVNGIYLVVSGRIKTFRLAMDGRELLTGIYHKEQYFGVPSFLSGQAYQESAEAMEDSSVCLLPSEMIDKLLNKYPAVALNFIKLLSNSILDKEEQLLQLAYNSVKRRIAQILLRLNSSNKANDSNIIKISRDDLASMAGMATETVSRVLSDFKDQGLIEKTGSQIHLIDETKLQNIKN
ncbi:response regulator [Pedobacter polaris]|uniref:Response regulator n=1 Tax=Pedobacter polaris TaxID=2571273 RepID=A0A4U1CNB2_9SPHI|nr:response regulator [Pedobacter polaris]